MNKKKLIYEKVKSRMYPIVFFGVIITLSACSSLLPKEEKVLAPPLIEPIQMNYNVVEAKMGEVVREVKGTGALVPSKLHDVHYTRDGGRLKTIHVKKGDHVEKGDVLAEIETGTLSMEIEQLNIELKKAQIRLQQLKAEQADRYSIQIAELDIEGIQTNLYYLHRDVNNAKVTAPEDGVVSYVIDASEGNVIQAYDPLFRIFEAGSLEIQYSALSNDDIKDVKVGMEGTVEVKGKKYTGKVIQTPSEIPKEQYEENPEQYNKIITLKVDDLPETLQAGDMAKINIVTAQKKKVLTIPKEGLRTSANRYYVQTLEDNMKREVDVEVGISSTTTVEIISGLEEGATIITNQN